MSDIFAFPVENIIKCGNCDYILQKEKNDNFEISIDLADMKEEF